MIRRLHNFALNLISGLKNDNSNKFNLYLINYKIYIILFLQGHKIFGD